MPGVFGDGHPNTTFAGITATGGGNIGISMDGVTMNTGTHVQGLKTATFINPDMVDEVRVVVAAVDVEGRGSAQIQVRTRSGTNQFHGGATLNVRNSALDANTWSNKRQHVAPLWYNRPQYTASLGGPIIRNKTFFFGMFDGQDGSQKEIINTVVLTDLARQSIFRSFPASITVMRMRRPVAPVRHELRPWSTSQAIHCPTLRSLGRQARCKVSAYSAMP
jgi:hypothetical protein